MTTNTTSTADVATDKPVPYMRQLCKHFGHRIETSYDESTGYIVFGDGRCELQALTDDGTLRLTVTAPSAQEVERVCGVVGSHLERFGRRDELAVSWS